MANASVKTTTRVVLELSAEEAGTLLAVVGVISGHETQSPRRHTRAIWEELKTLSNDHDDVYEARMTALRQMRPTASGTFGIRFEESADG